MLLAAQLNGESTPKLTILPFRGFSSRSEFQHHLIASGSPSSRGYLCVWAVLEQPEEGSGVVR